MGRQWDCLPKIYGIYKHVEQVVLCLRFLLHGGSYCPPQTLLLDLSGPLGGEGKATRRREEGRGRKEFKNGKGRAIEKGGQVALAHPKKS